MHLIVVPLSEDALSRGVGEVHRRYTRCVSFHEGWRGHLWQGRFASFVMEVPYLIAATRYIERNPVRAKLVPQAEDWPFSSAAAHVASRSDPWVDGDWLQERIAGWVCSWGEYLAHADDPQIGPRLRRHENTGRPLGNKPFIQRVGKLLGRHLLPKKPGPKRKQTS